MCVVTLSMMLLLSVSSCVSAAHDTRPVFATTIDFMDSVWEVGRVWTEDDTEALMKRCAANGIQRVYLRFANGVTDYPSKVTKMYTDDGREPGGRLLAETIRKYDCLKSHLRLGHKYGLQMYFYEPLYDDEITVIHYSKGTKEERLYGEFPMKSPFTIRHPEYQIAHRRAHEMGKRPPLPRHIGKIKLYHADAQPTRIDKEHLVLWTSNDNAIYSRYDQPWSFEDSIEEGVRALTLSDLNINARFVKIQCTYRDRAFTFWNTPGKFARVFGPRGDELNGAAVCYMEDDTNPSASGFTGTALDFALDYNGRSLGLGFDFFSPYVGGMLEYCYPQARDFRVAMVREVVRNYDVDGVAFCLRSHNMKAGTDEEFGFGEPVVSEYRKRYGVDIRTREFDHEKWAQIRGEGVTQLLREVRAVLKPRGIPLQMMVPLGTRDPASVWRYRHLHWIDLDWPTWTREKIVSGLILNPSDSPTDWNAADRQELQRLREATRNLGTEIVTHFNINNCDRGNFERVLSGLCGDQNVDTINLYEERTLWPTSTRGAEFSGLLRTWTGRTR